MDQLTFKLLIVDFVHYDNPIVSFLNLFNEASLFLIKLI